MKVKSDKKCIQYKVKEGETISQILNNQSLSPIYGKNGSLLKTLKMNNRKGKSEYLIYKDDILCLPEKTTQLEKQNKKEIINNITSEDKYLYLMKPINQEEKSKKNTNIVQKENPIKSQNFHMIYTEAGIRYLEIIKNDPNSNIGTSAELLSKMMLSIEVGLIQKWHPKFQSYFGINYTSPQIMKSDTSIDIKNNIVPLGNFIGGIKYHFLPHAYGQIEYGYGDDLSFTEVNTRTIQMEKITTAKLNILGGFTMFEYNAFELQGEFAYLLNTQLNNEPQIGKGYEGAIVSTYHGKDWNFKVRPYYKRYKIINVQTVFDHTETGILFRLSLDL